MTLRLAEKLVLLLLDESTGELIKIPDRTIDYGLVGAVLIELSLEGRIDTDLQALFLIDQTPVGDPILDPILEIIAAENNSHSQTDTESHPSVDFWIQYLVRTKHDVVYELREVVLNALVEKGILDTDDGRALFLLSSWVSRTRRYPTTGTEAEREIHDQIMSILLSDDIPEPDEVAIISLVAACSAFEQMMSADELEGVSERINLIAQLDLIGQAISNAVRRLSDADALELRRSIQRYGGSWPQASGRLPILGHAFKLSGDVRAYFTEQYLKHGPIFEVQAPGRKLVVLAGQEANIFATREARSHLRSWDTWRGFMNEVGSPRVVTGSDGPDHVRMRKTIRNAYSRNFILRQLPEAVAIVDQEIAKLSPGQKITVQKWMQLITTEQICQLSANTSALEHIEAAKTYLSMLMRTQITNKAPKIFMRLPHVKRARRELEEVFADVLAAHDPILREGLDRDVVDDLLELHRTAPEFMGDTDLFINVMGPFLLGLDTVASSTAFMFYAVLKDPEIQAKIRLEADQYLTDGAPTAENIRGMTNTQYTVLETLRAYPIAPAMQRTVATGFEFAGHYVPAGTNVLLAFTVPHYLEEFFPNPERFDIDRYSPARRENAQRGVFSPFGIATHACSGQGYAQVQMVVNIARLLQKCEFEMDPPGYQLKINHSVGPRPHDSFKARFVATR